MSTDLRSLRHEYAAAGLAEADLAADPMTMFDRWLGDAVDAGIGEPNAMVVSTVSAEGLPSSRMVLLKGVEHEPPALCFYTNYDSAKGRDLAARPVCALLLPWHDLERQVRVEGTVEPMGRAENQAYFSMRPRGSQIGAWASPQSEPVSSREELDERYASAQARFEGTEGIEVPERWGGYRVRPARVEFWQGRRGRMHDRLVYSSADQGWSVERLAP